MKQPILFLLAILITVQATAQETTKIAVKKGYIRFGLGYAFRINGQTQIGTEYPNGSVQVGPTSETYSVKPVSLGSGLNAVFAIGTMPHPNVGFELGVSVGLLPAKHTLDVTLPDGHVTVTTYGKMPVIIMPSVVFQAGERRTQIYGRMGLALPVYSRMIQEVSGHQDSPQPFTVSSVLETKSRFAIGFQGAVGAKLRLNNRIAVWAEANALSLNTFAKSAEYSSYKEDGVEYVEFLPASVRSTEYEFDGRQFSSGTPNGRALTYSIPFSNAGISVGIAVGF